MEPAERGREEEEEEPHQLEWAAAGTGSGGGNSAACCLCPAAVMSAGDAAPSRPAPFVLPRHALEQELLRRAELQQQQEGGGDRRRERRMKNRESAARSRARRHAYLSELEKEVELLRAENEELRRLYEEVQLKTKAAAPAPVKRPQGDNPHQQQLQRTSSSAPM